MTDNEVEQDEKDLKIKALLDSLSSMEERVADLRVRLTLTYQVAEARAKELAEARQELTDVHNAKPDDYSEGS